MRRFWTFTSQFLMFIFLSTACDNETIENSFDIDFEALDKDANQINLTVTTRYRLTSRLEKKLVRTYGRRFEDRLIIPTVRSVSREALAAYSASEIYNYKRKEIEEKLEGLAKTAFVEYNVELTDLLIRSVELPDALRQALEKEHLERLNNKDKQDEKQ